MASSTSTTHDVIIVGGSFAGLACAEVTAKAGLRTLVLEKKRSPGLFPHTTGILVKEAAAGQEIPPQLTRKIEGVRLYAPGLHCIDLRSPGYYFLATQTQQLIEWFATRTERAGARLRCGTFYRGATYAHETFRLTGLDLRAKFLVGADGPRSQVARDFGLGINRRFLIGVEAEYEGVRGLDEDFLHCFLDTRLAQGYIAWVLPGLGMTQVGLACLMPAKPDLAAFIAKASKIFDFSRARLLGKRGGLIPVGGTVKPYSAKNLLLVGDAAGLVSPLTAGGIHTALFCGRRAGEAIAESLLHGGAEPGESLRAVYPNFFWKKLLRRVFNVRVPHAWIDYTLSSPPLRALAKTVFFHHRGLFSLAAWKEFVHAWRRSDGLQ